MATRNATANQQQPPPHDEEQTKVGNAIRIAKRQFSLRQQIEETRRIAKDQAALYREQLRKLEDDLAQADQEWASPMVQGELF